MLSKPVIFIFNIPFSNFQTICGCTVYIVQKLSKLAINSVSALSAEYKVLIFAQKRSQIVKKLYGDGYGRIIYRMKRAKHGLLIHPNWH